MIRTQIQLQDAQYLRLKRRSAAGDGSIAQLIRDALELYFQTRRRPGGKTIKDIAGKFRPTPPTGLKKHDRELAEAILASKRR